MIVASICFGFVSASHQGHGLRSSSSLTEQQKKNGKNHDLIPLFIRLLLFNYSYPISFRKWLALVEISVIPSLIPLQEKERVERKVNTHMDYVRLLLWLGRIMVSVCCCIRIIILSP